jgi:IclR family pca regulon transcriptional regulator
MRTADASFHAQNGPPGTYIRAFARGLAVIRAFGADAPEMTLSRVAERTGLTRANARRILLTLEQLGYVRLADRRFRLTARTLDLGFAYLSSMSLSHIAQPVMEDLASRIQQRCNVAVLDGEDIIYVLRVAMKGETDAYPLVNIGRRFPAYATAMGRVLLGTLAPDELERVLESATIRRLTPHTVTEPARLRTIVESDRRNGWAFVRQEQAEISCSIGVPLRDRTGAVIAALGSGWFPRSQAEDETRRTEILPQLLVAADEINRAMMLGNYDAGGMA